MTDPDPNFGVDYVAEKEPTLLEVWKSIAALGVANTVSHGPAGRYPDLPGLNVDLSKDEEGNGWTCFMHVYENCADIHLGEHNMYTVTHDLMLKFLGVVAEMENTQPD